MSQSTYKILFSVNLLHEYYTDQLCKDFEIIPSDETENILKGQRIILKYIGNELIAGISAVSKGGTEFTPLIPLPENLLLKFYLIGSNSFFGNFTNLNFEKQKGKIYYFSNLSDNNINNNLYLTIPISAYNSSDTYLAGDFADDGSGNIYEAIKNSSTADPHNLTDTNYWKPASQNQYASADDLISISSTLYSFTLPSSSASVSIKIFSYDDSTNNYDYEVYSETRVLPSAEDSVPVDLSLFEYGKYKIDVNGKSEFVYYDNNLSSEGIFGVIEIFSNDFLNNHYELIDSSENLQEPVYVIKFRNRSTYWRYTARTSNVTSVSDSSGLNEFEPDPEPMKFVSKKPIPLTEGKVKTIQLGVLSGTTINSIRNPSVSSINQIEKDGNNYFCSEIFLNN